MAVVRKPVQDADLTALSTLVGAEGTMHVQIFRDVNDGQQPTPDWEHLGTWPVTMDEYTNGEFVSRVAGNTGGGLYRFVASKPGSTAKPVEWGVRLPGDPKPPPHVRAEREARRPAASFAGQGFAGQGFAGQGFAGAPVSPLPVGGGGMPPGYMPFAGPLPYGGPTPYGHGYGHGYGYGHVPQGAAPYGYAPQGPPWWAPPPPTQQQQPVQHPASDALTKAVEGMTSVFTDVLKTRREEATVPTEVRAELDRMRDALDVQKREAAEVRARHERELAEAKADAQRAHDRAEQQARDAKHDQEIAQMRADSDKRFEAIQNEMKQAAERAAREAADKSKSTADPTVTAMTEALKMIAKQAEEAGKDARTAMTEAFKAAASRQEHPDWLIQLAMQQNAPQAMQQMASAYGQLFQTTAALTQAQISALADQLGEGKSDVVDALKDAFGGLVQIGKRIVDRAAEPPPAPPVRQHGRLAGAQPQRTLPSQAQPSTPQAQPGANGTARAPAPVVPLRQQPRGLNWGSLSEPHGQLAKAVAEYNLAPEVAAEKVVALVEFAEAFGLQVAPTLIRMAQSNLAELVEVVLPDAPPEYRAKVAAAILAATKGDEDGDGEGTESAESAEGDDDADAGEGAPAGTDDAAHGSAAEDGSAPDGAPA